ncbi:uncharacterized protein [Chiloscyllium punctatum]|uniref:uncharacterized protein n=1 Tax=Chiloscyllium punctatum TaxID=137246 RepID=UPI003B63D464
MAREWLAAAKEQVRLSEGWQEFSQELFDVVLQQLAESHVASFTDLSTSEKTLFVERAARTVNGGSAHRVLTNQINTSLEEHVANHFTGKTLQNETVLSLVQDGVVTLLQKWPGMKSKLCVLFNHTLPPELRKLTWHLFLSNTKARMEYLFSLSGNLVQSSNDMEISLKCESLLSSQPIFKTLSESKYAAKAMSKVLSYYQKIQPSNSCLSDINYLLLIPLVQVSITNTSQSTTLSMLSTLLVEEYLTLMKLWPCRLRVQANQEVTSSSRDEDCFEEVANLLEEKDKEVSEIIKDIYSRQRGNRSQEDLLRGLHSILCPVISTLFVGHLTMETVLYIWDQYILGLDQPSYNCIPAFCMAFIHLLREHLQTCKTPGEVDTLLKSQAPALTIQQFQKVIKQHFYTNLYKRLNKENNGVCSLLDPMEVGFPQAWTLHRLFKEQLANRTHPKERHQARLEQEAKCIKQIEKAKQEEKLIKLKENEELRREEAQLQRLLEETKRMNLDQKHSFEEKLQQEQHLRYEMQRKAEEQVKLLQVELRQLMQQNQHFLDVYSLRSFTAPPPSLESSSSCGFPLPEHPVPPVDLFSAIDIPTMNQYHNSKKAENVTFDLLHNLIHTADSIANGQGIKEKNFVNGITQEQLHSYDKDVRNAEIQMDRDELDTVPDSRAEIGRKLTDAAQNNLTKKSTLIKY